MFKAIAACSWSLLVSSACIAPAVRAQDGPAPSPPGSQDQPPPPGPGPGPPGPHPGPPGPGPGSLGIDSLRRPPPGWLLRRIPQQRASFKRFSSEVIELKKTRPILERGEPCAIERTWRISQEDEPVTLNVLQHETETRVSALLASTRKAGNAASTGMLVIPVVVHVVLPDFRVTCVSDRLIYGQIDALNRDFGPVLDADYMRTIVCDRALLDCAHATKAAPPCIRFQLASRDPDGLPTTGILRVQTTVPDWDVLNESATLTADAWPVDRYLNVWVTDIRPDMGTANFAALGEIQGIASHQSDSLPFDGLIVDYRAFGDYTMCAGYENCSSPQTLLDQGLEAPFCERELGRTCTHELGHWMNLLHPWGESVGSCGGLGDLVDDTPNQQASNGMCTMALDSCPDGVPDMCNNFMDYPADALRVFFTAGQVERMRAMLFTSRLAMLTSTSCIPPVAGSDPWVADTWADSGSEPAFSDETPWNSPDLWLRRSADGGELPIHQSPALDGTAQSVYVRLRNRGADASPPVTVSVFWSEASLQPPVGDGSGPDLAGGLVGTHQVPSLPAGSTSVVRVNWTPPSLAASGAASNHVGLVARVSTGTPPSVGIEASVADPVVAVLDDNDLAWKNCWVIDTADQSLPFRARGPADPALRSWFALRATGQPGESSLMHATVVTLAADGVGVPTTVPTGTLTELDDKLMIFGPVALPASTWSRLVVHVQSPASTMLTSGLYTFELVQWTGMTEPEQPVGGALVLLNLVK